MNGTTTHLVARCLAVMVFGVLASSLALAAPGGGKGKGGGGGDGGDPAPGPCAATASYFPALTFVQKSGARNRQKDIMLASADGSCTTSVHMISGQNSDIFNVELLSEYGLLAWTEFEPVSKDVIRTRIMLLRFSVAPDNTLEAGEPEIVERQSG